VAKGLDMGKRWLLSWMRRGVLSSPSFPDNSGVRYFDQSWLRKAVDVVERGMGRFWARKSDTWNISGVERKSEHGRREK
jgi:hypothetical protein